MPDHASISDLQILWLLDVVGCLGRVSFVNLESSLSFTNPMLTVRCATTRSTRKALSGHVPISRTNEGTYKRHQKQKLNKNCFLHRLLTSSKRTFDRTKGKETKLEMLKCICKTILLPFVVLSAAFLAIVVFLTD